MVAEFVCIKLVPYRSIVNLVCACRHKLVDNERKVEVTDDVQSERQCARYAAIPLTVAQAGIQYYFRHSVCIADYRLDCGIRDQRCIRHQ